MIKRKRYLNARNADGSKKSPPAAAGGDKRRLAELEASLAESEGVVKGLEMQLKAGGGRDEEEQSNEGNDALVPYGHTRTPFKKRG